LSGGNTQDLDHLGAVHKSLPAFHHLPFLPSPFFIQTCIPINFCRRIFSSIMRGKQSGRKSTRSTAPRINRAVHQNIAPRTLAVKVPAPVPQTLASLANLTDISQDVCGIFFRVIQLFSYF
jgi:hypothetical protein